VIQQRGIAASGMIMLAACSAPNVSEQAATEVPEIGKLQEVATRDCQCRLAGHERSRYAKEYARLAKGLLRDGFATSSFPVSYQSDCFPGLGENACVLTGGYLPPSPENFVCTEAQGVALEDVWEAAYARSGSETQADEMVLRGLDQMRDDASKSAREEDCT